MIMSCCSSTVSWVFPGRLTSGGIFNNSLLFRNNKLLFSLLFLEIFVGKGQGSDGGGQRGSPQWRKPGQGSLVYT